MKDIATERRAARQQPYPPPAQAEKLPCPRCESTDTKFCYYNNYNPSQPRHFCKACRRYWTQGGSLRNIPVGGGTRKRPRPSAHVSALSSEVSLDDSNVSSFTSLLSSEGAASFMDGYEVGPTTAFDDGRGIWAFPEEAPGWQVNFLWPELASRTQVDL